MTLTFRPVLRIVRPLTAMAALIGVLALSSGCQTIVPRFRTLPKNYQAIYIPMVDNQTFEPGIEDIATRMIQEEFMADGRLRVTRREDADIITMVILDRFNRSVSNEEDDDFPQSDKVSVTFSILVFERGAVEPFGVFPNVKAQTVFLSNTRQSLMRVEGDWKKDLFYNLAKETVVQVITGDYSGQTPITPPADQMFPEQSPPGARPNLRPRTKDDDSEIDYRF